MLNIENIKTLKNYLEKLPEDYQEFNMLYYAADDNPDYGICTLDVEDAKCNTIRCAVGHGPAAGLTSQYNEWSSYTSDVFGANIMHLGLDDEHLMAYMFDGTWAYHDNTFQGACNRMKVVIDHEGDYDKVLDDPRFCIPWE